MDELDQLLTAKQDVVYNFFNWPTLRDSQLYVIAVANRMDLPQHLAAKVKSRLGKSPLRWLSLSLAAHQRFRAQVSRAFCSSPMTDLPLLKSCNPG